MESTLEVADAGSGPAVVLSHGTLLDHEMYAPQVAGLSESYRVLAYTSRAGNPACWAEEHTLDDLVDDCLRVADAADVDRFVLGGMSVGGFMALEAALKHPDRIAGLLLIGTMANAFTAEEKARYAELLEPMNRMEPIQPDFVSAFEPVIFGPKSIADNRELVERWTAKWKARPSRTVWCEYRSWIDRVDRRDRLGEIQTPTLVIHGEQDGGIPLERARELADGIPGARLLPVPQSGHIVTEERADLVTRGIRSFLDALPRW
jgi:pimeloyl-ACP methyl ester carboxylesterase